MSNLVVIFGDHKIGSILTAKYYDTFGNELQFNNIRWFNQDTISSTEIELLQYRNMKQIQILKPISTYITAEIDGNFSQKFIVNMSEITPTIQNTLPNIGNGINLEVPVSTMAGLSSETNNTGRINQSLRLILNTDKGEYPMLPNFGCNLNQILFQTIQTEADLESIRQDLLEDITRQEPRIDVKDIQIGFDYINTIMIVIEYVIRNTNITGNLLYDYKIGGEVNG